MRVSDFIDFDTLTYKRDVIESVPEFAKLKECKQNPKWHAEGTAWDHTKRVCEEAFKLGTDIYRLNDLRLLLTSALFHDIGKGTTTFFKEKDQQWHAYGHEVESERITRELRADEENKDLVDAICKLVRWHMVPLDIKKSKHKGQKILELAEKINPTTEDYNKTYNASFEILIDLKLCDVWGSDQMDTDSKSDDVAWLLKLLGVVKELGLSHWFPAALLEL